MQVESIKTQKIRAGDKLMQIFDESLPDISENTILAVTSKIVSICEGNLVSVSEIDKKKLVANEADLYLPPKPSNFDVTLTIKNNILIANAGIDESNGDGKYILWPTDPYKSANIIRQYLRTRFRLKNVGVIITDSMTTPLRWGTTGIALAYSGFQPLRNYIGQKDIFDREMAMTKANVMDGLAAAAVLTMGEGDEQTPLAIITDTSSIQFCDQNPTLEEINDLKIDLNDDLYSDLLTCVSWKK